MNTQTKKPLDHAEALALHETLVLKSRFLTAALESANGEKVLEPKLSKSVSAETVYSEIEILKSHCEKLQAEVNTACKHTSHTWNPDAQILARRGVKTLAELNMLPPLDVGD